MRNVLALAAIGATLSFAAAASAQAPPSSKPTAPTTGAPATAQPSGTPPSAAPTSSTPTTSSTTPTPPASSSTAPSAAAAGSNTAASASGASLMTGMSVKDNTGAIIGEVKDLKAGVATIQMGSDSFTVDANKLGVSGGAATINATQAQLKQMITSATKK